MAMGVTGTPGTTLGGLRAAGEGNGWTGLMGEGGAVGGGAGIDGLKATAGGGPGTIGATGSGATGATGAGAAGALAEGLPMRMEVSGSPFEPNRPVTVSGTSTFLCPARRGSCSGRS